jgi:hypothetical protein
MKSSLLLTVLVLLLMGASFVEGLDARKPQVLIQTRILVFSQSNRQELRFEVLNLAKGKYSGKTKLWFNGKLGGRDAAWVTLPKGKGRIRGGIGQYSLKGRVKSYRIRQGGKKITFRGYSSLNYTGGKLTGPIRWNAYKRGGKFVLDKVPLRFRHGGKIPLVVTGYFDARQSNR